jgi:hypothetical protein
MAAIDILQQATKLYSVSETLAALAEQNAQVSDALSLLAKSIRQSATLLEVVVAVRMGPEYDVEKRSN